MEIEIAAGTMILVALVFLATVDMAFSHISDLSLRRLSSDLEESGNHRATVFLREVLENRPRFRFALSAVIQVLLITFAVLVTISALRFAEGKTGLMAWSLTIGLISTVVFRQVIPRLIVHGDPERILVALLPLCRPIYAFLTLLGSPIAAAFRRDESLEAPETHESTQPNEDDAADDFHALMEAGEAEGIIEEQDRELIESMVEFSDTRTGEIMTPRTEIVALPVDATVKTARNLIIEEKYSRLPVYRDSIDNIEGVIYVRDLLQAWASGKEEQPITEILRPAYFVPETKTASELLRSMQRDHVQFAIVIDEYGGVAGIVTVEDIIEEIVGEIEDEDIEEEEIIEIIEGTDGYWDVLGSTEIDKIERLFGIEIKDEDFTTIAGLVTSEAGYVPKIGEKLHFRGLDFEILRANEKRVSQIRIRRSEPRPNKADTTRNGE